MGASADPCAATRAVGPSAVSGVALHDRVVRTPAVVAARVVAVGPCGAVAGDAGRDAAVAVVVASASPTAPRHDHDRDHRDHDHRGTPRHQTAGGRQTDAAAAVGGAPMTATASGDAAMALVLCTAARHVAVVVAAHGQRAVLLLVAGVESGGLAHSRAGRGVAVSAKHDGVDQVACGCDDICHCLPGLESHGDPLACAHAMAGSVSVIEIEIEIVVVAVVVRATVMAGGICCGGHQQRQCCSCEEMVVQGCGEGRVHRGRQGKVAVRVKGIAAAAAAAAAAARLLVGTLALCRGLHSGRIRPLREAAARQTQQTPPAQDTSIGSRSEWVSEWASGWMCCIWVSTFDGTGFHKEIVD